MEIFNEFQELWLEGGVLMWPLLLIAIFMYWNIFELFAKYHQIKTFTQSPEAIEKALVSNNNASSFQQKMAISEIEILPYFELRLKYLSVLAGVSPLFGLLGTVMGMLDTFSIMTDGNIQKIDLMAGGISEALITTQMGLIIAIPAMLMIVALNVKQGHLKHFFEKNKVNGDRLTQTGKVEVNEA